MEPKIPRSEIEVDALVLKITRRLKVAYLLPEDHPMLAEVASLGELAKLHITKVPTAA